MLKDQATYGYETEDTISSHSGIHFCEHMEHPYHLPEMSDPYAVDLTAACEVSNTALISIDINGKQITQDSRAYQEDCSGEEHVTWKSFVCDGVEVEVSDATKLKDETVPLPKAEHSEPLQDSSVYSTVHSDSGELCEVEHADHPYCSSGNVPVVTATDSKIGNDPELVTGLSDISFKPFNCTGGEIKVSEDTRSAEISPESPAPVEAQQYLEYVSQVNSIRGTPEASGEAKDSAIGSSENGPVLCNSVERPLAKHLSDVVNILSESSPVALLSHLGISSPIVRRASLLKAHGDPAEDQFLADDSAFEGEKSLLAPGNGSPAGLWADHLESPMPRPLFNSTALGYKAQSVLVKDPIENLGENVCAAPHPQVGKPVLDIPLIPDGPLQQQLRKMAEFLIFASGKMGPSVCASAPPSTAFKAPPASAESHSVCVGTSPLKLVDHSLNTSGLFERKREFSVVDSCTLTDPLLWK